MPNISPETLGTGHYPEDVFHQQIYEQGIQQDWWIEETNYRWLLHCLQRVTFEEPDSRYAVANTINSVDKDLPANPGIRFPCAWGVLGAANYHPVHYVRVPPSLKARFIDLISLATHVIFLFTGENVADIAYYNHEAWREAARKYGRTLRTVATTVVETYSRAKFERDFNLNWIRNPDRDADVVEENGDNAP